MGRSCGAGAEVTRSGHQSSAEMMKPDAVDHHPRGERILFAGYLFRQFPSAAALRERVPVGSGENFQKLSGHFIAFIDGIAALENSRIFLNRTIFENDGERR